MHEVYTSFKLVVLLIFNMEKEKIKKHFLIGIDTSYNKLYSYMTFGPTNRVNQLKDEIEHICLRHGVKKTHFCDIEKDQRKIIYPEIISACLKYNNVNYIILEHKRPSGYPSKDFYLRFLPKEYTKIFDFLKNEDGIVKVDVHDDFSVTGITNSTYCLLDSLARYFTETLTDKPSIFRDPVKKIIRATIICKETGKTLLFNFNESNKQTSNAILVADIIIGFHQLKVKTGNSIFSQTTLDRKFLDKIGDCINITPLSPYGLNGGIREMNSTANSQALFRLRLYRSIPQELEFYKLLETVSF